MKKRILGFILAAIMVCSLWPASAFAAGTEAANTLVGSSNTENSCSVLAFTADIHNRNDQTVCDRLAKWITNTQQIEGAFDFLGICGDLGDGDGRVIGNNYWSQAQEVIDVVEDSDIPFTAYTTGNHEQQNGSYGIAGEGTNNKTAKYFQRNMAADVAYDANYAVYLFGAPPVKYYFDYKFLDNEITMLETYLKSVDKDIPVFVMSHYPLHNTTKRTVQNIQSVIALLNQYPNVIFIWGHNHTDANNAEQHYDRIYTDKLDDTPINFTYCAAGCMSDSEYTNGSASVEGKALLATVSKDNQVTLFYTDANGLKLGSSVEISIPQTELTLSDVTFIVKANKDAGLDDDVKVSFTKSDNNYNGTLYLPGGVDTSKLMLSWADGVTVEGCKSGETLIPCNGENKSFSVTMGDNTANFTVKTMQSNIPQCVVNKNVPLSAGTYTLTLGGQKLGEYTFAQSGNNWTIKDSSGKYLGFANNRLSDNAFGWTYSNGRFQTSVTTTTGGGNTGWGGFSWSGFSWRNSRTKTTTYYLAYTGGRITVSTSTSGASASFTQHIENLNHAFSAWTGQNGVHTRTCSVCDAEEQGNCSYGAWITEGSVHSRTCSVCNAVDSSQCSFGPWTTTNGVHCHTCMVCSVKKQGNCIYGDWIPDEEGQHAKICSVCGDKHYENCNYGANHLCSDCGRIDPNLVYVTATFVTGEGASVAPAAQTVIKDEGLIVKPKTDSAKVGFLFGGWYVGDSEFNFDASISENVIITAKWTECNEHDYDKETHICSKCGLKDPEAVVHCSGDKTVSLTAGKLIFALGNQNLGEHTFTKVNNNTWTIKDNQKNAYLGIVGNAFAHVDEPFNWTFSNNRFRTSVSTTRSWSWSSSRRFTATTYYLAYVNGKLTVSTGTNGSTATFMRHVESNEHSGTWKTVGKTHTRICEICGETESENCTYVDYKCTICGGYDPDSCRVDVSVKQTSKTESQYSGWFERLFGRGKTTTTYTAAITTKATGTTVKKVEYSTNSGKSWSSGSTVISNSKIGSLLIRVTDSSGKVYNFKYDGLTVILQNII